MAAGATINQIASAINTDLNGEFQVTDIANGNYKYADSTIGAGTFASGTDPVAAGSFSIEATNGKELDGTKANATTFTYTSGATTGATFDADTNVVAVTYAEVLPSARSLLRLPTSTVQAAQAVPTEGRFIAQQHRDLRSNRCYQTVTTAGTDSSVDDVITVTAKNTGTAFNKNNVFQQDNALAVGAAQASIDSGTGNIIVKPRTQAM